MRARELPASTLEFPFGPGVDVFKVRGKMFMFHTTVDGERQVILKALPSDSMSLRDAHADITPGYHMNKRHWISLHPGGSLDADMVSELVTESYRLVVAGLPRTQQPVEPHAFGRGQR
ncbi:MmcQ/YjbR family DNA-binding protein [Dietzia sp. B32]|uniref:MmcQ/YjbR family DNA-binding protein n=1 Tax=Dietzia sp. B32 TaxID=2915130 RepID=UPI0021AD6E4B|nr:MmcQ/YjbR family DNA-binding protein [Dietzia sp. B32]UVE95078.1 MmcQ/YjbR family DNA-binding protein [Dietzia sp. B32]